MITKTLAHGAGFAQVEDPTTFLAGSLTKQGVVLGPGSSGTWDAGLVESPTVRWDANAGQWAMVYTGYDGGLTHAQVGLAWSSNLTSWSKDAANPVLTYSGSGADANGCTGPLVYLDGSTYHWFYIGLTGTGYEGGTPSLCHATSTSYTGTKTRLGQIIAPGGGGWRDGAIYHPSIVKRNSTWYLFFNAKTNTGSEVIGYATSSDLNSWTVDDANSPLLSPTSGWESFVIGDPSVFQHGSYWYMAYYGAQGGYTNPSDGWAYTTDGNFPLGWTRYSGNPVLTPTAATFDSGGAGKPFILLNGTTIYHYYTGDTSSLSTNRRIGLATSSF